MKKEYTTIPARWIMELLTPVGPHSQLGPLKLIVLYVRPELAKRQLKRNLKTLIGAVIALEMITLFCWNAQRIITIN